MKVYSPEGAPIQAVEGDTDPTQKIDVDGSFDDLDVRSRSTRSSCPAAP